MELNFYTIRNNESIQKLAKHAADTTLNIEEIFVLLSHLVRSDSALHFPEQAQTYPLPIPTIMPVIKGFLFLCIKRGYQVYVVKPRLGHKSEFTQLLIQITCQCR